MMTITKPTKEKFGWHTQKGFEDEPSGWVFEGGEEAYESALKEWSATQVTLNCMICKKDYLGEEIPMCCSGHECGCMGLPTEPAICSKECGDKFNKQKGK